MELHELIDQYYAGDITESDARTLENLLRTDAAARARFVAEGRRHEALRSAL